jgi:hypothetical protein
VEDFINCASYGLPNFVFKNVVKLIISFVADDFYLLNCCFPHNGIRQSEKCLHKDIQQIGVEEK